MLLSMAHLGVLMLRDTSKLEVKTSESWGYKPLRFKSTDLELPCPPLTGIQLKKHLLLGSSLSDLRTTNLVGFLPCGLAPAPVARGQWAAEPWGSWTVEYALSGAGTPLVNPTKPSTPKCFQRQQ